MQIDWVLRYEGGRFTRGRADCLGRELPKNGDGPKSPLSENGSLMPSAGTISTQKSTLIRISGAIGIGILR
jgi:hypothetical protein